MCAACSAQSDDPEHTDPIRAAIIKDSIANYQQNYRNCPCPYTIRDGKSCGRDSAYSNGYKSAPVCYPRNITTQMVEDYKNSH